VVLLRLVQVPVLAKASLKRLDDGSTTTVNNHAAVCPLQ
jgi:hypothetical protein